MFTKPMRETLIIYARINAHLSRTFLSSMDRGISSRLKRVIQINALLEQRLRFVLENIGLVLFLEFFWISRAVRSMNLQKKNSTNIYIFIIWLALRAGKMNQIARCDQLPERARWSHLARSGLPAVSRKQSIINPLLTKFARWRWLDIGLVLFLRVYGPRLRLRP